MSTESTNYSDGQATQVAQPPMPSDASSEVDTDLEAPADGKKGIPKAVWIVLLVVLVGIGWIVARNIVIPILMFSKLKPQPTPVQLSNPEQATVETTSEYVASLQSRQSITLQPRATGQIQDIFVKSGDRVGAGEPILQIDAADQQAEVASQEAITAGNRSDVDVSRADAASAADSLKSLQARRDSRVSDVEFKRRDYQRQLQLFNEGAISRQALDQAQNSLRDAEASLDQVDSDIQSQRSAIARAKATIARNEQSVRQAEADVQRERVTLDRYTVTAPIEGIIGDIPVKVGDFVNTATELLTITQNQQLEIQIDVPIESAPNLKLGLPVDLLGPDGAVIQRGRLSYIAPNVNPATQSIQVKAVFNNAKGRLRANQFLRARVIWSTRPGVTVPTSGISRLGGQNFIFVAVPYSQTDCSEKPQAAGFGGPPPKPPAPDQLVAYQKPISLGKIINNNQEVLEGLTPTDRIITTGILSIQNCMPIVDQSTLKKGGS